MSEVTHILSALEQGDPSAAEQLLPLVYDELRKLAAARLASEPAGQTLQPTALVHEAYLRLVGGEERAWDSRGHFFAAAAEAMRRVLVDQARRKQSKKRGGDPVFAGLSIPQAAAALGVSPRSADYLWAYARARLPIRKKICAVRGRIPHCRTAAW